MTNSKQIPKRPRLQYLILCGGFMTPLLGLASAFMTFYLRGHHAVLPNPFTGQTVYLPTLYRHGIMAYVTPFEAALSNALLYGFLGLSLVYIILLVGLVARRKFRAGKS